MGKKVFITFCFYIIFLTGLTQDLKTRWVDSVFQELNTSEKIGQLFMISASAYSSSDELDDLNSLVRKYQVGGVLITRGGPISHSHLVNTLQATSKVPLFIGMHAEWGLGQSLDSVIQFQKAMQLAALRDDTLIYRLGQEIAREMKLLGIHINFAPNADMDIRIQPYPQALRYFSDSKERVAAKALSFMKGLQHEGVLACAIHPASLQKINELDSSLFVSIPPLDTVGLYPYRKMVHAGLQGLLTSHLHLYPHSTAAPNSKTQIFISEILNKNLGFRGLNFADIPNLQKAAGKQQHGAIERLALEVGNDILINPDDISAAIRAISKEIRSNKILKARLNDAVRKILSAKYDAGLAQKKRISTDNLLLQLNAPQAKLLRHQISEATVTLLSNRNNTVPIQRIENRKFISVSIGREEQNEFTRYLSKYASFEHLSIRLPQDTAQVRARLNAADVIVVGVFPMSSSMIKEVAPFIQSLTKRKEVIVSHFGNPTELQYLKDVPALLVGYTDQTEVPKMAAQIIFGAMNAKGQFPVTLAGFKEGYGISSETTDRLAYSLPEAAGIDSKTLSKIEAIAREAIEIGATPGSHVLVAKDGKVVYEQSNGYLTYENKIPVSDQTIYDLASVTKVSATLQTVMFMQEKGLIDVNKKISVYLPELKKSNKKDFTIKDILTHQAGLWPFLPFWSQTLKDGRQLPQYYSSAGSEEYPFPVAENLFAHKSMKDSLWSWIIKAKVREKTPRTSYTYTYSDMGFYILQHLAEKILNQPMDGFLEQNLYEPLGAYGLGYLPLRKFPQSLIAPTENDVLFRKKLLTGYVHDQGAAMHGGIAGHAGLFGSANDLAKLGQMLLQKGSYGGHQYFKPETVELFTTKQYETSRRGLGWDKPTSSDWNGPTTLLASNKTFGHTGFTGTCIWVDPEFNLVFIYLSNRVYPDMTNNRLLSANIRPRIQEVIYKAIFNYRQF
jgi:CubicO group peptidase (beta-lactamase class C family)/beta-glucosidase-like glycosyl hydrolase